MLATDRSESVYSYEGDTADSSSCRADCLAKWKPVLAPSLARAQGEWSLLERSPAAPVGFRGKPLYTYILDSGTWSQQGSDEPGWENVFTQVADSYPDSFRPQHTMVGDVLADSEGKTIYIYHCGEDSQDQLGCDHPTETQVYRLAMCGAGDPERCLEYWPYVLAGDHEQATNRTWSIVWIDPRTGRFAAPQQEGALRVWAYRDRPVYTFAGDSSPGDVHGGGTGEWRGQRNGLKAIMLRDDFFRGLCDGNLSNAQMAGLCPGAERLVDNLRCSGRGVENQNRTISYVMTDLFWSVYQTEDAQAECPKGFNDGPREQFEKLFPDHESLSVEDTQLAQEIQTWHPNTEPDGFEFSKWKGIILGSEPRWRSERQRLHAPDGTPGIDNEVYRAVGCIIGFRGPDGVEYIFQNKAILDEVYNRMMIELTEVDSLENDDSVIINLYRGWTAC